MDKAAIGGLGVFCLISVASLFGRTVWLFELLTHFRVQYVVAGAVLALVLAARRRWIGGATAAALAFANAVPVLPFLPDRPGPPAAGARSSGTMRVIALNLRHRYGDVEAVRRLVRAERPDVVLLTELVPEHLDALMSLGDILPYRVGTPPRGKFDSVLLSRLPIAWSRIHFPAARFLPVIEARLCRDPDVQDTCVTVIALHAPRPDFRRGQPHVDTLALVAERVATVVDRRVVVVGDLNTTPFSHRFRDLVRRGGLTDTAPPVPDRAEP